MNLPDLLTRLKSLERAATASGPYSLEQEQYEDELENRARLLIELARLVVEAQHKNLVVHHDGCPMSVFGPRTPKCSCGVADWLARVADLEKGSTDAAID